MSSEKFVTNSVYPGNDIRNNHVILFIPCTNIDNATTYNVTTYV